MPELLIMEDERPLAQFFREVFEIEDYTVYSAQDAAGALAFLRAHPRPIVAFLHHRVTEENAMDVLAAAETAGATLRRHAYVLYTWHDLAERPDHRQRLFRMGAWLIPMPADVRTFLGAVEDAARSLRIPE
jgi:DNA-binding NtrC family response regulator